MPPFKYTARDANNKIVSDTIEAASEAAALVAIRQKGLTPMKVDAPAKKKKMAISFGTPKVPTADIVIFTRQFSTMIDSGLPLVQSIQILRDQTENELFREQLTAVINDVESGLTLGDAMKKHPITFDELYVAMVVAGEAGGILDQILQRLATFMETSEQLIRKVKGAMLYPTIIFSAAGGCISILLIFVVPTFEKMFREAGAELPLPTQIVISGSNFLKVYWWACIAGGVIGKMAFQKWKTTPAGHLKWDSIMLAMPILGPLQRKTAVARFTRTLGTLLAAGVSILEGLEIVAKTAGNRVIENAILGSRASIAGGETVSKPLAESGVFPKMVTSMIAVGEATGGMDTMLNKIADFYDEEVNQAVETLLSAMEPVMIVFLGVVVGGMIMAMYLPIFNMINTVGE